MRHRLAAVVVAALAAAVVAPAQPGNTYTKAAPPDKAVLDRLNLRTEWVQYLPVEGTRVAFDVDNTSLDVAATRSRRCRRSTTRCSCSRGPGRWSSWTR